MVSAGKVAVTNTGGANTTGSLKMMTRSWVMTTLLCMCQLSTPRVGQPHRAASGILGQQLTCTMARSSPVVAARILTAMQLMQHPKTMDALLLLLSAVRALAVWLNQRV
jgi:hypothetical protein